MINFKAAVGELALAALTQYENELDGGISHWTAGVDACRTILGRPAYYPAPIRDAAYRLEAALRDRDPDAEVAILDAINSARG